MIQLKMLVYISIIFPIDINDAWISDKHCKKINLCCFVEEKCSHDASSKYSFEAFFPMQSIIGSEVVAFLPWNKEAWIFF